MKVLRPGKLLRDQSRAHDAAVRSVNQAAFGLVAKRQLADGPDRGVIHAAEENQRGERETDTGADLLQHDSAHLSARNSAMGPRTATGMNIRRPRMTMTPHSVNPNV